MVRKSDGVFVVKHTSDAMFAHPYACTHADPELVSRIADSEEIVKSVTRIAEYSYVSKSKEGEESNEDLDGDIYKLAKKVVKLLKGEVGEEGKKQ